MLDVSLPHANPVGRGTNDVIQSPISKPLELLSLERNLPTITCMFVTTAGAATEVDTAAEGARAGTARKAVNPPPERCRVKWQRKLPEVATNPLGRQKQVITIMLGLKG